MTPVGGGDEQGDRYFLKWGPNEPWTEVSKDDFAAAEARAGYKPAWDALPGELATSGFGSFYTRGDLWLMGRVVNGDSGPELYKTDPEFRNVVWPSP